jgi:hypothetical protein
MPLRLSVIRAPEADNSDTSINQPTAQHMKLRSQISDGQLPRLFFADLGAGIRRREIELRRTIKG